MPSEVGTGWMTFIFQRIANMTRKKMKTIWRAKSSFSRQSLQSSCTAHRMVQIHMHQHFKGKHRQTNHLYPGMPSLSSLAEKRVNKQHATSSNLDTGPRLFASTLLHNATYISSCHFKSRTFPEWLSVLQPLSIEPHSKATAQYMLAAPKATILFPVPNWTKTSFQDSGEIRWDKDR